MVEAALCEGGAVGEADVRLAGANDLANARAGKVGERGPPGRVEVGVAVGRDGKEQFEVFAVEEGMAEGITGGGGGVGEGDAGGVEDERDLAFLRKVPEFGGEAIADVDHGVRPVAKPLAFADARGEREVRAGEKAAPKAAGDAEDVAGTGAGTQAGRAAGEGAAAEDVELERFAAAGVAADDRAPVLVGEGGHAGVGSVNVADGRVAGRDEIDENPARYGTHGGDVAEHATEGLVADEAWIGIGKEVVAADDGIGLEHEILGGVGRQAHDGAVVTDTSHDIACVGGLPPDPGDEWTFAQF